MKTVIIVDDSKTFQRILEQIMAPHFKVLAKGASGTEGFELYKQLKPDLVLMDITMPNCSGKEALKLILDHDPNAKVIMVSGLGDDATVSECIKIGAKAFVKKEDVAKKDESGSLLVKTASEAA